LGRGESASARWAGIGDDLRAGVDIIGLGPPVRPERLPIEFTLTVSSSCCLLLRMEELSYPAVNVSEVERILGDADACRDMVRGAVGIGGAPFMTSLDGLSLERGRSGELLLLSRDGLRSAGYGRRSEVSEGRRCGLRGATAAVA
jgi:hypothetical protein